MAKQQLTVKANKPALVRKHCLFCDEPLSKASLTSEHPVPQWLLRHFGAENKVILPAGWRDRANLTRSGHRWVDLVVSDVCARCNSGWLSDLENAAKKLLPGLSSGDRGLGELSQPERCTLARWATKTGFLVQCTAAVRLPIAPEAFGALRDRPDKLPPGTFVFAFQDNGEHPVALNGFQTQDWTVHAPYEDALEIRVLLRKTGKISLRLDRLHLLVAYTGDTALVPVGWWRVHQPVYPTPELL